MALMASIKFLPCMIPTTMFFIGSSHISIVPIVTDQTVSWLISLAETAPTAQHTLYAYVYACVYV